MMKSTLSMTHEEWLKDRNNGIGGSDVGTILGLNKWKSPYQLWLEKTNQVQQEYTESEPAYWGNVLEEVVAKEFQERTGKKVMRRNQVFEHEKYPFLRANIDRWVIGENAILECKTANQFLGKEWENEEIPTTYLCQVQHYMNVLNADKAYIAVLIGGQKFIWKEIERDQELIDLIQERLTEFWENNVLGNQEPQIDGEASTSEFLKNKYNETEEKETILNESFDSLIVQKNELKESKKSIEQVIRQIDNQIISELGKRNASIGITPKHTISWKLVASKRLNTKKLKEKYPEVATDEEIYSSSESRRLTDKEIN